MGMMKSKESCSIAGREVLIAGIVGADMEDVACHICGKVLRRTSLRRHIMDRHFPSQQTPCHLCGKIFKTANSLSTHMNAFHKSFKAKDAKE
ncbi:hypothetical protein C0J52_03567 [Blattella germanica]|nr:hypothetical protein C0J52_03567 [Blattella germanica]